jgi:hypothetical protein
MQFRLKAFSLGCSALGLVGCASIIDSHHQSVTVFAACEGRQVPKVACNLQNDKGRWYVQAPGSTTLKKSYGDLGVACRAASGATAVGIFSSSPTGALYGNGVNASIGVWGGSAATSVGSAATTAAVGAGAAVAAVSWTVDSMTGAGFQYPQNLVVEFSSPCPR